MSGGPRCTRRGFENGSQWDSSRVLIFVKAGGIACSTILLRADAAGPPCVTVRAASRNTDSLRLKDLDLSHSPRSPGVYARSTPFEMTRSPQLRAFSHATGRARDSRRA